MFYNIKTHSLKIFLLACLFVLCACDNRKGVCIEADDFGFEDIERFDVLSFASPTDEDNSCKYRTSSVGFSSSNTDLQYCLNGAEGSAQHCEESYDGYVEASASDGGLRYCRFLNNDLSSNELQQNEFSCIKPDDTSYKNKGCRFDEATSINIGDYFFSYTTNNWPKVSLSPSNALNLLSIKNQCIASCVERCKKRRACSHVASRLPIYNGPNIVASSSDWPAYDIFNPYTGKFILKHSLDGNLFVANSVAAKIDNRIPDNPIYTFEWTDNSSELKDVFSKLQNADNRKKLSLAIAIVVNSHQEKAILIDNFDSCTVFPVGLFKCQITASDILTKVKLTEFFTSGAIGATSATITNAFAVAIFDYVKIAKIDISERTITTATQHHFGTNSILEIVNDNVEYKIKVKRIVNSTSFMYDDIYASPVKSIDNLKNTCESVGAKCFLIPSVENIDSQDKFMPPWKSTTLKSSPTSAGGLQISAGSKVEIQAVGDITLGDSVNSVCHKVTNSLLMPADHVYGLSLLDQNCNASKTFPFTQQTQYKPNISLDIAIAQAVNALNFYRSLTDVEKSKISHPNNNQNDLCKSLCYVKIKPAATLSNHDFACDKIVENKCQYSGANITHEYKSSAEQVRIANYTKKVVVAAVSPAPLEEGLGFSDYLTSTAQNVTLTSSNSSSGELIYSAQLSYSDLKSQISGSSKESSPYPNNKIPLYVVFRGISTCRIKAKIIKNDDANILYPSQNQEFLTDNSAEIIYPNSKIQITDHTTNCSSLQITVHPFILFTATQSGFVQFRTQNACILNKALRVINKNQNYPKTSKSFAAKSFAPKTDE